MVGHGAQGDGPVGADFLADDTAFALFPCQTFLAQDKGRAYLGALFFFQGQGPQSASRANSSAGVAAGFTGAASRQDYGTEESRDASEKVYGL